MANEVTFLDLTKAKTIGWSPAEFALELNLWDDKSRAQLHNLITIGLDKTKFQTSVLWSYILRPPLFSPFHKSHGHKMIRIFLKGFTITDQIDSIIREIIGDQDDVKVPFLDIYKRAKEKFMIDGQHEEDFIQTIKYNLNPTWLKSVEDKNFYTAFIENERLHGKLPILPSVQDEVFKAGFDVNMEVLDEIIW